MSGSFDTEQLQGGFWVGDWFVEPLLNRTSRADEQVSVEPKVMEVLLCLARHVGRTVTKERFMEQVWADTVVTEDVLSRCISELRKVFGDDPRAPRFIETIRKTGYRLIAPVRLPGSEQDDALQGASFAPGGGVRHPISIATLWKLLWRQVEVVVERHLSRPLVRGALVVVLLIVLGGTFWYWRSTAPAALPPPASGPFTSYPGQEIDPALSPDGNQVAFAWDNNTGRDFDIYIKQAGAEPPLRITDERTDEHSPAWSPDGLHLAFIRSARDQHALFVVPAIGGSERKVIDFGASTVQAVTWSADGRTLAVSAQQAPYGVFRLFLVALDSATAQPLTAPPASYQGDLHPVFSPDGKRLAFIRSRHEAVQDLYVVGIEGGEPERRTFDRVRITGVDWSADGKHLVFASHRDGASGLWRIAASGDEPAWILTGGEGATVDAVSIARRGNRLVYTQRSSNTNIWRLWRPQPEVSYRAHLFLASTRWESHPHISPAGTRIAYASNQSGTYEIWTCDRNGRDPVQLTTLGGVWAGVPRWSPDGRFISFVAYREGQGDIYVIDAEGGTPRLLTTAPADDAAPGWSHDGRWIYFASSRNEAWEIWKTPVAGGDAVQVTETGGWAALASPDGTVLYYVKPHASGIWQRPVAPDTGSAAQERLLIDTLDPADRDNWAVTPEGIYFVRRDAYAPVLAVYRFATEQVTDVATLNNVPQHPSLAVGPEETWFLYTQVDRDESDILLMEHFR